MTVRIARTAEHVGCGHPDKFCDQVADAILDQSLARCRDQAERSSVRVAIECLAKDNHLTVSGEVSWPPHVQATMMCGNDDIHAIAKRVWQDVGYGPASQLAVINNVRAQSPDIAKGGEAKAGQATGVDFGGAGDQGVMVGYATDETESMMPREWSLARQIAWNLEQLRKAGTLPWLRSDVKSQVSLDEAGGVTSIIAAVQHAEGAENVVRSGVFEHVLKPLLDANGASGEVVFGDRGRFTYGSVVGAINGTGKFEIGGTIGDAGVVGRKIVVDAYGPRVPVGGGAYSGKDPSKVDRSAAYMARHIAKYVVAEKIEDARECTVHIAYGIGQLQPEMVTAVTDAGVDVWAKVKDKFSDLSQGYITSYFDLRNPTTWSYQKAAAYGHYGRTEFPWEQLDRPEGRTK